MVAVFRDSNALISHAQPNPSRNRAFRKIWIVEDDANTRDRDRIAGVLSARLNVLLQLHFVVRGEATVATALTYETGQLRVQPTRLGRAELALKMLDLVGASSGVVVAGSNYGSRGFMTEVRKRGLDAAVEVRHSSRWPMADGRDYLKGAPIANLLESARWKRIDIVNVETGRPTEFRAAELGRIAFNGQLRAFAFTPGAVIDRGGDLRIGLTSLLDCSLDDIVQCVGWVRWIRTLNRRRTRGGAYLHNRKRTQSPQNGPRSKSRLITLQSRPNIRVAKQQDQLLGIPKQIHPEAPAKASNKSLKVLELFAGAGGLGLGFLLAGSGQLRYRIVYSAEVEPIYLQTIRNNHQVFRKQLNSASSRVPKTLAPLDLRLSQSERQLCDLADSVDGIDIIVGGPPCQGFSNANRNNWSAQNPNNQHVDVFLRFIRKIQPRMALMENVQGILWTDRRNMKGGPSVADHVVRSLRRAGYWIFPKLLDAVWYGVPQHRARFFMLAIHEDSGYRPSDFDSWGPFPTPTHGPATGKPYVTVKQAISDLPQVGNGATADVLRYREPSGSLLSPYLAAMRDGAEAGIVTDHVTSCHAGYVLQRYQKIPPGGNWQAIQDMMRNYAAVERTHSNIYRRLRDDEPAITIGHYRKSMLVHPTQDRGLSLREAARLQSFPDWFRFAGSADGHPGGLMHKQQQLANAVSPLVAKAIANYLLAL